MKTAAQRKADLAPVPTRFLSIGFPQSQLEACLELALELKSARTAGVSHIRPLEGRHRAAVREAIAANPIHVPDCGP